MMYVIDCVYFGYVVFEGVMFGFVDGFDVLYVVGVEID